MKKFCYNCKTYVDSFLPAGSASQSLFVDQFEIIGSDIQNFSCPNCRCFDRERHLLLFFNELKYFKYFQNKAILHIAPERNFLTQLNIITDKIIVGDINPQQYESHYNVMNVDITNIQLPDGTMDLVIANHVLEHVPDYFKALSEIFRVLKKDGCAVLQTPFSDKIYNNFEDKLINTDELRQKWYGRYDHVRIFGLRFFDDIKTAGFNLHLYKHNDLLGHIDSKEFGVNFKEPFISAIKF